MLYADRMSSLTNALNILGCLTDEHAELRVTQIAKQVGLPKSTVSRTLAILAERNILERDDISRSYRVGSELFRLSNLYKSNDRLVEMMEGALREIVRSFDVTGYISVLRATEIVFVRAIHSASALRFTVNEGDTLPAFITALGKALLARVNADELPIHLPKQLVYKPLGIDGIRRTDMLAELEVIRQRGFATLHDAGYRNAGAIGIALIPKEGTPVAFAVNYPLTMLGEQKVAELTEVLIGHAERIAGVVGDSAWRVQRPAQP